MMVSWKRQNAAPRLRLERMGDLVPEAGALIEGSSLVAVTNAVGRFQIENVPAWDTLSIVEV